MTENLNNGRCCAIIPAFEEGGMIARVVRGARRYATEVLVVDDGSSDDTAERAQTAGASVVRHECNLGKGLALLTGIRYAAENGYEIAVTLDGDGQHDPSEIPKLLAALQNGADIIVGSRMGKPDGMPVARLLTNMAMSAVLRALTGCRLRDTQSGFKAMRVHRLSRSQSRMSTPPGSTRPLSTSYSRSSRCSIVLLPIPLEPSRATVSPDCTRRSKSVSTGCEGS